jgi:hypothetical protein
MFRKCYFTNLDMLKQQVGDPTAYLNALFYCWSNSTLNAGSQDDVIMQVVGRPPKCALQFALLLLKTKLIEELLVLLHCVCLGVACALLL